MKKLAILVAIFVFAIVLVAFPKASRAVTPTPTPTPTAIAFPINVKIDVRGDKKAFTAVFKRLNNVKRITYWLSYKGDGVSQGAAGTIKVNNQQKITREFIFGTCSAGVCTYYNTVKQAKLTVQVVTEGNQRATKTFHIDL